MIKNFKILQNRGILTILIGLATFIFSSCSLKPNEKIQNEAFQFSTPPKKHYRQLPGDDRWPAKFFTFNHAHFKCEIQNCADKDSSWHSNV